jgi:hypothetical protein
MPSTYKSLTSLSVPTGVATFAAESHNSAGSLAGDSDIVNDTQDIGTSSELITLGEIAAGGAALVELVNLDATNFVSVGFENPVVAGTKTFKIKPGQSLLVPTPSGALYAIADTDTVKILKKAVEA